MQGVNEKQSDEEKEEVGIADDDNKDADPESQQQKETDDAAGQPPTIPPRSLKPKLDSAVQSNPALLIDLNPLAREFNPPPGTSTAQPTTWPETTGDNHVLSKKPGEINAQSNNAGRPVTGKGQNTTSQGHRYENLPFWYPPPERPPKSEATRSSIAQCPRQEQSNQPRGLIDTTNHASEATRYWASNNLASHTVNQQILPAPQPAVQHYSVTHQHAPFGNNAIYQQP